MQLGLVMVNIIGCEMAAR